MWGIRLHMDTIFIEKLEVFARHGVYPEENKLGQKFLVSAELAVDTEEAGHTDDLTKSVNYGEVAHRITQIMQENTHKLIEAAAADVCENLLLEFPLIQQIRLKIEKPWAPVGLPLASVGVEITRGWHTAYIALGSNMGDKEAYLQFGVDSLSATQGCQVTKVSSFLRTAPYGGVEQDDFLNGVLELRTILSPTALLTRLHEIEADAHRERKIHWGPRTLDLDIIFYDDLILDTPDLHIPHIDMANRDFVLTPLAEIAPYMRHPIFHKTVDEMKRALK